MSQSTMTAPADAVASIAAHIERIRALMGDISHAIVAIAQEFTQVSNRLGGSDKAVDELHACMPGVDLVFWRNISKVSAGILHPLAISSGCNCISALERLPLEAQEKALTTGVPVSVGQGDHRMVPAHLLTVREVQGAISASGYIRSVAEQDQYWRAKSDQKAIARAKKIRKMPAEKPDEQSQDIRYEVSRDMLIVHCCPFALTLADLNQLMREMRRGKVTA